MRMPRLILNKASTPILVLLSTFFFCAQTLSQNWTWTTEAVDSSGQFTSLAIDSTGNLHMSYIHEGRLRYAFRSANDGKWFKMEIDVANNYTGIAVDRANNPYICYTGFDILRYAHWDGKSWFRQEIAPGSGQIGYTCSIAVADNGTPNLIWYQLTLGRANYFHLKHAVLKDGAWQARTVDLAMETGKWNSLRLDQDGNPHVSYSVWDLGEQRYAYWNGKSWIISTVEGRMSSKTKSLHPGYGNSLALGPGNTALVSYMDDSALKFARQQGEGWSIEEVDKITGGGWIDFRSSLLLDSNGVPHIAYQDSGSVKHAYWNGKEWQIQVIAARGTQPVPFPSMVINRQGVLFIGYLDPQDGSVKVAVGSQTQVPTLVEKSEAEKHLQVPEQNAAK
jgi:hypothetical protein